MDFAKLLYIFDAKYNIIPFFFFYFYLKLHINIFAKTEQKNADTLKAFQVLERVLHYTNYEVSCSESNEV